MRNALRKIWIGELAVVASLVFGLVVYDRLPDSMAIHWGINLEPDGYASRLVGVIVLPLIGMLVAALPIFVPLLDPRRDAHEVHARTLLLLANGAGLLLASIQVMILGVALGWNIDVSRVLPIGVGLTLLVVGNLSPRLRRNWFLGIRTPWTLSDDEVWRRTQRVGGTVMTVAGLVIVIAGLTVGRGSRSVVLLAGFLVAVIVPVVYSFVAWKRVGRSTRSPA